MWLSRLGWVASYRVEQKHVFFSSFFLFFFGLPFPLSLFSFLFFFSFFGVSLFLFFVFFSFSFFFLLFFFKLRLLLFFVVVVVFSLDFSINPTETQTLCRWSEKEVEGWPVKALPYQSHRQVGRQQAVSKPLFCAAWVGAMWHSDKHRTSGLSFLLSLPELVTSYTIASKTDR